MQTFKAFYKTTLKHMTSLIIYTIIFMVICLLMSSMLEDKTSLFSAEKVDIAIFDYDKSTLSEGLTDYIAKTHTIVELEDNDEIITDELFFKNVQYVLRIKEGFSEDFNNLENIQIPGSMHSNLVDSEIDQYLNFLSAYSEYDDKEAIKLAEAALEKEVKTTFISESDSDSQSPIYYFFLYLPYIFVAIIVSSLGGVLLVFRNKDLSMRIQCSSVSITRRNVALTACCILFSLAIWLIFMFACLVLQGEQFFTMNSLLFVINSLVTMSTATAVTYLISFFAKSNNTLSVMSNIIGLGLSFVCGIFIPIEVMDSTVVAFAKFFPTYWYVQACKFIDSYTAGASLNPYFNYVGIQVLFSIAILVVALAVSKIKKKA